MKGKSLAWIFTAALAGTGLSTVAQAQEKFVTIGTGGQTGVYYVAGQSICRFVNRNAENIKCNAPASGGGVANVNGLRSGEFNFGIMQSDHQYKAMEGVAPFEKEGKMDDIRAVFSLQSEVFTVLARRSANIKGLDDLKGKRVNIGNPGSGQRDTLEEIMKVKGWDKSVFSLAAELKPAEQASALGDNNIDAMTGPEIDKLLEERSYYTKAEIPGGLYKGNDQATQSIGGKAVLSTTSKVDAEVVYQLVKSVFENIERFQRLHPAFKDLKPEEMIEVGLSAPLHEGAERYYKERGWL